MKKKLIFAVVIALTLIALLAAPAFAWDYEDQIVVDNEYFIAGGGIDDGVMETQSGAQAWPYGKNPNDGFSLYQDDITDTGNLDQAFILTFTPDEVDLPIIAEYWHPDTGSYWYKGDVSPNTWYWATGPRGYDRAPREWAEDPYLGMEGTFTIELFGSFSSHKNFDWATGWNELPQILGEDVYITRAKNGTTLTLEIPNGTEVSFPYRPGVLVTFLSVKMVGGKVVFNPKDMDFSEPVTLTINGEVITFTEIRDGSPVL